MVIGYGNSKGCAYLVCVDIALLPDTKGGPIANIRIAIRHQHQKHLLGLRRIDRAQAESHSVPDVIVTVFGKWDDVQGRSLAVDMLKSVYRIANYGKHLIF